MQIKTRHFKSCGGLCFILSTIISFIIFNYNNLLTRSSVSLLFSMLFFGFIGLLDDLIKIKLKDSKGLSGYIRLLLELIGVLVLVYINKYSKFLFINNPLTDKNIYIGGFALIYIILCIIGSTNAVNLTDGLDSLSSGLMIISLAPYLFLAIKMQNISVVYFIVSLIGSLLAFLIFNFNPSKLIMGDVGSLSLGSSIAIIGILLNKEILILVSGFVFILEIISVILQVSYFKITKGKRIFKMTPLHYHFIKLGMSESNVVIMFYIIGIICSILACIIGVMI